MKPRSPIIRAGFTLVELLVAIAVLAIIVVVVAQMVGTASTVTTVSNKHIDANSQARTVFDRMADDFARMIKRNDVDCIFCKANGTGGKGLNDTMFFFSEGASYFNNTTFSPLSSGYSAPSPEKNSISLVGYRVNNGTEAAAPGPTYYQMERLGKALSWDTAPSINPVVFLTYPAAGTDVAGVDRDNPPLGSYSTAYFGSTLYGAYSSGGGATPSIVGTLAKNFNDGTDSLAAGTNPYRPLASQVFRFEFAFQLKDGTRAAIPVMTPSAANSIPSANLAATNPPTSATDSTVTAAISNTSTKYAIGSRWYDTANQIGYICVDATPGYAQWKEIGIKDIAAVVVTITVIDKQGSVFINASSAPATMWQNLSAAFADVTDAATAATVVATWTTALTPPSAGAKSAVSTATGMPQAMVSQIRIYQRYFYINNL
jgi:prepilin-type N-terminal cleavage/methylation domain-containing protein